METSQIINRRRIAEILANVGQRLNHFFWTRAAAGLPWFWPSRPTGKLAMVEARRSIRRHFGNDPHPVARKLAQVFVTIAWPFVVLRNLWMVRRWFTPRQAFLKRVPGA